MKPITETMGEYILPSSCPKETLVFIEDGSLLPRLEFADVLVNVGQAKFVLARFPIPL
jgi:hypothetical protein